MNSVCLNLPLLCTKTAGDLLFLEKFSGFMLSKLLPLNLDNFWNPISYLRYWILMKMFMPEVCFITFKILSAAAYLFGIRFLGNLGWEYPLYSPCSVLLPINITWQNDPKMIACLADCFFSLRSLQEVAYFPNMLILWEINKRLK